MQTHTEQIYSKYITNPIVTFEEFIDDMQHVKPTFIPILDICMMRLLDDFIHNLKNYYKWKECINDIGPNIIKVTLELYPELQIDYVHINDMIQTQFNKREDPFEIVKHIFNYVQDIYKKYYIELDQVTIEKYYLFRSSYQQQITNLLINYQDDWTMLDNKCDNIVIMLMDKYVELESDDNFIKSVDIIDAISESTSVKINTLITNITNTNTINENMDELYNMNNITNLDYYKIVDMFNNFKISTTESFNKQMDIIYENHIKLYNFDEHIYNTISTLYNVEKAKHNLSLSIKLYPLVLNYIITKKDQLELPSK
jgi:hypothetical protein